VRASRRPIKGLGRRCLLIWPLSGGAGARLSLDARCAVALSDLPFWTCWTVLRMLRPSLPPGKGAFIVRVGQKRPRVTDYSGVMPSWGSDIPRVELPKWHTPPSFPVENSSNRTCPHPFGRLGEVDGCTHRPTKARTPPALHGQRPPAARSGRRGALGGAGAVTDLPGRRCTHRGPRLHDRGVAVHWGARAPPQICPAEVPGMPRVADLVGKAGSRAQ
jgi:hypothetical protein